MVGEMISVAARPEPLGGQRALRMAAAVAADRAQQAQNGISSGSRDADTVCATLERREIPRKNKRMW